MFLLFRFSETSFSLHKKTCIKITLARMTISIPNSRMKWVLYHCDDSKIEQLVPDMMIHIAMDCPMGSESKIFDTGFLTRFPEVVFVDT